MNRLAIAVCLLASACPKAQSDVAPAPAAPFRLTVAVASDPGRPVSGARILFETKPVASSDASGLANVEVNGHDGETVSLVVVCPEGHTSPEKPITTEIRRLASGSPPPRFEVRCLFLLRKTVVGVRTENGAHLPILYLGREVARTDALGVTHFSLELEPGEQVALTLSTADKSAERRPQNPTLTFVAQDQDDMVMLEQKFTIERKRVVVKQAPKPQPL